MDRLHECHHPMGGEQRLCGLAHIIECIGDTGHDGNAVKHIQSQLVSLRKGVALAQPDDDGIPLDGEPSDPQMKALLLLFIQIPASARESDVEHMKGKSTLGRIPDELLEDHLALRADDLEFVA